MSLLPPGLKSPVVIALALVLLAVVLWGSWVFLRRQGTNPTVRNSPANLSQDQEEDTTFRDLYRI